MFEQFKSNVRQLIDSEHGEGYSQNVDLSGYIVYYYESFISFHFNRIDGIQTVEVDYIYATSKNTLIKLLSFCIEFWQGHDVKFMYTCSHKREANYAEVYLNALGFNIHDYEKNNWKREWTSTNGFEEDDATECWL